MKDHSALLEELVEVGAQGVIVLGPKDIEFCNNRARQLNGVPKEFLDEGKPWLDFFQYQFERGDFGNGREAEEFFETLLGSFGQEISEEIERKAGNGRIVRAHRVSNSLGGITITLTDITDLKSKEAALEQALHELNVANSAKAEFLTNVSHELKTPLNGILGLSEVLMDTELDGTQRELAAGILTSGQDLDAQVGKILEFIELQKTVVNSNESAFNVRNFLAETLEPFNVDLKSKSLESIISVGIEVPLVIVTNETAIRKVLVHLLDNAIKFTERGQVEVSAHRSGDENTVRFSVKDTGAGIDREVLPSLFSAFSQADSSKKKVHSGLGIGLSLASSIVEQLGGELNVESEPGVGSEFSFSVGFNVPDYNFPPKS